MWRGWKHPLGMAAVLGLCVTTPMVILEAVRSWQGDPGHHWTHVDMGRSLGESRREVELRLDGRPFEKPLAEGRVWVHGPEGIPRRLKGEDIRVRMNHWPAQRASRLPVAMAVAALWGASLVLLVVGGPRERTVPPEA